MIVDFSRGHRQKMWIMHGVWPITALYLGPLALWVYFRARPDMPATSSGQHSEKQEQNKPQNRQHRSEQEKPDTLQTTVAVYHCGAGCTLGDIVGEWQVFMLGLSFAGAAFQTKLVLDFLFAYTFGVVFQYFTIAPMRGEKGLKGIQAALRADTASIVAFQMGLFGWMALEHFVLFTHPHLQVNEAGYWFMMQIGMMIGFFTSYPANVVLLSRGWKEEMPQYQQESESWERQNRAA